MRNFYGSVRSATESLLPGTALEWTDPESENLIGRLHLILRQEGIVTKLIDEGEIFADLPRLHFYTAETPMHYDTEQGTKQVVGYGFARTKEQARAAALGEAAERFLFSRYNSKQFVYARRRDLPGSSVDPESMRLFTDDQLKKQHFRPFRRTSNSRYFWVKAYDLLTDELVWLPAQFIWWRYRFGKREPRLWQPISNGAAAGSTKESALVSALYELIERDAFMIHWLCQITPSRVDETALLRSSTTDPDLRKLLADFRRYRLEVNVVYLLTDLETPVYCAVVRDTHPESVAVAVGAAANANHQLAIKRAVVEALAGFVGQRIRVVRGERPLSATTPAYGNDTRVDRGGRLLLWTQPAMYTKIEWFLKGPRLVPPLQPVSRDSAPKHELGRLKQVFTQHDMAAYYYEETTLPLEKAGLHVVKVVMPQMLPLYLHERWPYLGSPRLEQLCRYLRQSWPRPWNPDPHPFP